MEDVQRIDDLQLEHGKLFPEYHGLRRPKHHFLSHIPTDVWNYGPGRGCYWCFGSESFNRIIKRGSCRTATSKTGYLSPGAL